MLDVKGQRCLVVGGGGVALRKVQTLLEEQAYVTVISPQVVEPLQILADHGKIRLSSHSYSSGDVAGFALVFAATDSREVNRQVHDDADRAGIWVNVADDADLCSFHSTARVQRGQLQLSIGSAGGAPFVIRRLRQLLERRFGAEWNDWVEAATRFRTAVRRLGLERTAREALYDRFFRGTVDGHAIAARVPTAAEEQGWLQAPTADHRQPISQQPVRGSEEADSNRGFVSLVGSGPGCPGLLTVAGRQRLLEADVVVYDRLAAAALPCEIGAEVELHGVGKTAGNHPVPQAEICSLLVRLAREGRRVVRLKGGDPFVFGRGGEEAEVLAAEGVRFEVIPGVTSGIAAPAWIGIPVTQRREAVRLTLLTAHEAIKEDGPQVRWDLLAQDASSTIVGYMGVTTLPAVVERLVTAGMDPETPAAMIEQGTTSAQRHVVSTLSELPHAITRSGLRPPALFVIGPSVARSERLDWYHKLCLAGQRLVMAAGTTGTARSLEEAGAEIVRLPSPVTPAARIVLGALPITGCVVQSAAEVDWLDEERGVATWSDDTVAWCIGNEAATCARELGWQAVVELDPDLSGEQLARSLCRDLIRET
jgi:uroporphyrin-III C-methyltransferase/precorrin-2 dehydrogenase/sirohydrochlorin ferrochelatase